MTREELDEHIEYCSHTTCGYPPISIMASEVERWLEDIRDNGITDIKYTVQVIKGDDQSFLNQVVDDKTFCMENDYEDKSMRTRFTQSEIDKFKQRDDLAIDWDKAIIEPVEDK